MKTHIKIQNYHFLFLSLVAVLIVMFLITSCQKDQATNDKLNNIKTELRVTDWCDGTPMPIPPVIVPPLPYIVDDSCCCFTLQFSPLYTWNVPWQVIGVDNDMTYANIDHCGDKTGTLLSDYKITTCITTRATHITVSLLYPWIPGGGYCTMLPLPCK